MKTTLINILFEEIKVSVDAIEGIIYPEREKGKKLSELVAQSVGRSINMADIENAMYATDNDMEKAAKLLGMDQEMVQLLWDAKHKPPEPVKVEVKGPALAGSAYSIIAAALAKGLLKKEQWYATSEIAESLSLRNESAAGAMKRFAQEKLGEIKKDKYTKPGTTFTTSAYFIRFFK